MSKEYKSPRRLKVKPPKVIPHGKIYNRKKLSKDEKMNRELVKRLIPDNTRLK